MYPTHHSFVRRLACALPLALIVVAGFVATPVLAGVPRSVLKEYFQTGDKPTQGQFADMIDSSLNLTDDGLTSYRLLADSSASAIRLDAGIEIGASLTFTPLAGVLGLTDDWLGNAGFLALQVTQDSQPHFGYLQMTSTAAPDHPYSMYVEYWVFNDLAGASITTAFVPEPSSILLAAFGLCGLLACKWRRRVR